MLTLETEGQPSLLDLCDVSGLAYSAPALIETSSCHVIVAEGPTYLVVAFRGTNPHELWDLIKDGEAITFNDTVLGPVDDGFSSDVYSVAWRLLPYLQGLHKPFWVTGHSKGGAEALIFAAMCENLGLPILGVTTFESASPGALPLVSELGGIDFECDSDPIPLWPRTNLLVPGLRPRALTHIGPPRGLIPNIQNHFLENVRPYLIEYMKKQGA